MYESQIKYEYKKHEKKRICQGDILRDFTFLISAVSDDEEEAVMNKIHVGYAVILSQDCDLQQDFTARNKSPSTQDKEVEMVLICPAFPTGQFFEGDHIDGKKMRSEFGETERKFIPQNKIERYHYLGELEGDFPDLVVDFKRFFAVPTDVLYSEYNDIYVTTMGELFREFLSQRFSTFIARIGLPDIEE